VRPLIGKALQAKVPPAPAGADAARARRWPQRTHPRKVLMLAGCVQPAMRPEVNAATARVLDAAGLQAVVIGEAGCCGAVREHNGDHRGSLREMRRNIDAWWPWVAGLTDAGPVEAIVMNASGCGVMVKDYGHALAHDPDYADKARRVSALTRDLSELVPELLPAWSLQWTARRASQGAAAGAPELVLYHPPCTLQHGQQLRGKVERLLAAAGYELTPVDDAHLCCGSAGTYSLLHPQIADELRGRKLAALEAGGPQVIATANIGCLSHLQAATTTPVRHWIELLDVK